MCVGSLGPTARCVWQAVCWPQYSHSVGKIQYHRDTTRIASEKTPRHLTARLGLHRRAAPLPQPAAPSHGATLARRSRSAPTMWAAARAAQRSVELVRIVRRDSIILQCIHLDGAVLVPVHALSRSLCCLPLVLSTVHNICAWSCFSCSINILMPASRVPSIALPL